MARQPQHGYSNALMPGMAHYYARTPFETVWAFTGTGVSHPFSIKGMPFGVHEMQDPLLKIVLPSADVASEKANIEITASIETSDAIDGTYTEVSGTSITADGDAPVWKALGRSIFPTDKPFGRIAATVTSYSGAKSSLRCGIQLWCNYLSRYLRMRSSALNIRHSSYVVPFKSSDLAFNHDDKVPD